jgi:DNA modification methylase
MAAMTELRNQILHGDSVEILRQAAEPFADLVFADPPFNIGYKYDKYHDKKASADYLAWTKDWIGACVGVLKPHGSFYIAIGDEYVADIKLIADGCGLVMRNWIIWHYSFGQQMKTKFARAHTHILYFVKDPKHFTFNDEMVRVISDRQKKYADKRANPAGKMPDDVWNEYPRICGTFVERTGFPCQMPESLLARIVRVSSSEGDWVLDPFCGSGTTATVAHKLNRQYTSIDLSQQYVEAARERIGASEGLPVEGEGQSEWPEHAEAELCWLYSENKVPYRQLQGSPKLLAMLASKLNDRLRKTVHYAPDEVLERLGRLEQSAKLSAQLSDRVNSI